MSKIIFIASFLFSITGFASPLPTLPIPPDISNWNIGIFFNTASSGKTISYGICEFTPADQDHKAVVCPPPFYTKDIGAGEYLSILIPKDLVDQQGNILTHYTASITQIKSNDLVWMLGPRNSCVIDISKNLNAALLNEVQGAITCTAGKFAFLEDNTASNTAARRNTLAPYRAISFAK